MLVTLTLGNDSTCNKGLVNINAPPARRSTRSDL